MEIQMGEGEWLFCTVHDYTNNRHGLHMRPAGTPRPIGDLLPPYDPITEIPYGDVVVWFKDLGSLLIIQEQLVKCGIAMQGWKKSPSTPTNTDGE